MSLMDWFWYALNCVVFFFTGLWGLPLSQVVGVHISLGGVDILIAMIFAVPAGLCIGLCWWLGPLSLLAKGIAVALGFSAYLGLIWLANRE